LKRLQYKPYLSTGLSAFGQFVVVAGGTAAAALDGWFFWNNAPAIPSCFPIPGDSGIDPRYPDPSNASAMLTRDCLFRNETPWYDYALDEARHEREIYFSSPWFSMPTLAVTTIVGTTCMAAGEVVKRVGERSIAERIWDFPLHTAVDVEPQATAIALYYVLNHADELRARMAAKAYRPSRVDTSDIQAAIYAQAKDFLMDPAHPERRRSPDLSPPLARMLS
jgi:hypothetical protein